MGSTHLLLSSASYHPSINPRKILQHPKFSSNFRGPSSSRPNWDPDPHAFRNRRYEFDDDFAREKRRNWWSDDDGDDDEEEDEDEDDDDVGFGFGFGFGEETSAIDWIFKAFRAFGWMVPAVMISTLLGTGSTSLIMALVIPLGQTALSLVMDKLWGGPSPSPTSGPRSRSRSRPKRNPSAGTAYGTRRKREPREERTRTRPINRGYAADNPLAKKGVKSGPSFGGWDELDNQVPRNNSSSTEGQSENTIGLQRHYSETSKLSGRRNREKPLFMRLLISVFPFLGSWTRFLF